MQKKSKQNIYREIWRNSKILGEADDYDFSEAWYKLNYRIQMFQGKRQRNRNLIYLFSGMAASFIIFFCLAQYTTIFSSQDLPITFFTPPGNRSELTLPDGTYVRLNSASHIEYTYSRNSGIRKVTFNGEGYFNVHKSKHPFQITTSSGLKVTVLGTRFNLKAYPEDMKSYTTLIEGSVKLLTSRGKQFLLKPGQTAAYSEKSDQLILKTGNTNRMTSWLENKLYMDNTSLGEVCKILNRWYGVHIVVEDDDLKNSVHFSGLLKEETINDVLKALSKLSPIQYKIEGKNIIIFKPKSQ